MPGLLSDPGLVCWALQSFLGLSRFQVVHLLTTLWFAWTLKNLPFLGLIGRKSKQGTLERVVLQGPGSL